MNAGAPNRWFGETQEALISVLLGQSLKLQYRCFSEPLLSNESNRGSSGNAPVEIRDLLAGVNPNSDAIRTMISACLLTIER
jgi:hypothetical protein